MENKRLIICRGIPGSGKSTWAYSWVKESPTTRIRLNNDDIRRMFGPYWVPEREKLIHDTKYHTALNAMALGYDIVVDNMNLNPKEIKFWEDVVKGFNGIQNGFNYTIEFKDFFNVSLEECLNRDKRRENPVGEKAIREIWKRYKHFIQTTEVEKYVNNLRAWDLNKPTCVVVDVDSTLCFNTTKRPWFGEGAAEGMINDVENFGVCEAVWALAQKYPIIIATGRDTSQEEVTKKWLTEHRIEPTECYFRTKGDYRKGVEVKQEQIEKILEKYNILVVFEDCEPVVKMYRDMGLTVLQPNKGL